MRVCILCFVLFFCYHTPLFVSACVPEAFAQRLTFLASKSTEMCHVLYVGERGRDDINLVSVL